MTRNRLHERNTNPRYGMAIPRRRVKQQLASWVRAHIRTDYRAFMGYRR